jgi:hypothetical protein
MTKYFVNRAGKYLGGFDGQGALNTLPSDAVKVPGPPEHGDQKWSGTSWSLVELERVQEEQMIAEKTRLVAVDRDRKEAVKQLKFEGKTLKHFDGNGKRV